MVPRALVLASLVTATLAVAQEPTPALAWGEGKKLCDLADPTIKESSGLAASHAIEGVFWTHNDSGDEPRLFAIDRAGRTRAVLHVDGAEFDDWEDIASFDREERHWLLVADTGDNDSNRQGDVLYVIEEPRALPPEGTARPSLAARALPVRFEDGPHDCEGVGVDPTSGTVLLVTKERRGGDPSIFTVTLPALRGNGRFEPAVAHKLATVHVPSLTTALDVSPDGRVVVILSYLDAYAWAREGDEDWAHAFARPPVQVHLPGRKQGESICFGPDGRTLYLTSEKLPTPLLEVPPR